MSFLCCCFRPPADANPNAASAPPQSDIDENIEVARAADENFHLDELPVESSAHEIQDEEALNVSIGSQSAHRSQLSQRQRNAGTSSDCRVRWGNRCGQAEGVSQVECESQDYDGDDSFDEEMANLTDGSATHKPPTLYVPYPEGNNSGGNPRGLKAFALRPLALRTERAGFLERREAFTVSAICRINEERQRNGCQPLKLQQEFELLAEQLWKDLVQVRDGFAVVPRCVYFPRDLKRGERFGCLTYFTPRSARAEDCVPDAMVHFWCHAGVPREPLTGASEQISAIGFRTNSRSDFPAVNAGESYVVDKTSSMAQAFDKYRKYFPAQLLASECRFLGLHADMVQLANESCCNVICVAVVFDWVASRKGREMRFPIA